MFGPHDDIWRLHFSRMMLLQSVVRNCMQYTVWMSLLLHLKNPVHVLVDILRRLDLSLVSPGSMSISKAYRRSQVQHSLARN